MCQAQEKGDELVVSISEDEEKTCTKDACGDVVASMAVGHGALYSCVLDGTFRFVRQPKGWHSLVGAPWRAAWPLEPCVPSDCANFDLSTLPRADAPKDDVQKEMQKEMGAWFAPPTELKWTFRGHSLAPAAPTTRSAEPIMTRSEVSSRARRAPRSRRWRLATRRQPPTTRRRRTPAFHPTTSRRARYPLIPEGSRSNGAARSTAVWGKAGTRQVRRVALGQ